MNLLGKGFYIDRLFDCEGGDPAAILSQAQAAGLGHVVVKIADGAEPAGLDGDGVDRLAPLVNLLQSAGISAWGWQVIRGDDPLDEAAAAVQRIQELGLDGLVVWAGSGHDRRGREPAARQYMSEVAGTVRVPLALSSFRFPHYHPEFPWAAFLERCALHMPLVSWEQAHDAGAQLRESKRQCDALPNARPFVPTGAAYGPLGSWQPTQADLAGFLGVAVELGIEAANFYTWEACRSNLPPLWETISAFRWPAASTSNARSKGTTAASHSPAAAPKPAPAPAAVQPASPAEPDEFAAEFISALNSRQPGRVAALYATGATRVSPGGTLHGTSAIQADYASFFASLPLDARFSLIKAGSQGMVRSLTWRAGKFTGLTTLVLEAGKITQDYTHLE